MVRVGVWQASPAADETAAWAIPGSGGRLGDRHAAVFRCILARSQVQGLGGTFARRAQAG